MEAAKTLVEHLKAKGVQASLREEPHGYVVEIRVDGKEAEVRLAAEAGAVELRLHYPGKPGVTVLRCESGVTIRCAERLLEALKG